MQIKEIDSNSVVNFYVGDKTDKPTIKNSGVNVLYFTNKCNLACTYCYEDLPGRPPQIMTKEDIRKSVDSILEREQPDQQTLIVLFGGEPTLEWENVCYAMEYTFLKKQNVHFNMTSNGIKFLSNKFLKTYKNNYFVKNGLVSLDISFDGVGNEDRIFHNGKESTKFVIKSFKKMIENDIEFRIRYTIHKKNIENAYQDISRIIRTFKPKRLITSVAWDTLDLRHTKMINSLKQNFRQDWINKEINVPICELFCDMCNGCGTRNEIKTYYTTEGNVTTYGNYENTSVFHDFKEKVLT